MTVSDTYRLLIFDWDGTLIDSPAKIVDCLRIAAAEAGLAQRSDEQFRHIIGLGIGEAFAYLYPDGISFKQRDVFIKVYRDQFMYHNTTPTHLYDGVRELLQSLTERSYFLAIATGKGREGLDRVLEEFDMKHFFHASRCADETQSKPNPQMLLEILTDLDVAPDDALMIGDTQFDIEMARRASMHAIGITNGAHTYEQLQEAQPLAILTGVSNLLSWLDSRAIRCKNAAHV